MADTDLSISELRQTRGNPPRPVEYDTKEVADGSVLAIYDKTVRDAEGKISGIVAATKPWVVDLEEAR